MPNSEISNRDRDMGQKISKTWNVGLPIATSRRRGMLPDRNTWSLVVAPLIIKWGVIVGISIPVLALQTLSIYNLSFTEVLTIEFSELVLSYASGTFVSLVYRYFILSKLLNRLKKSGDIGREVWEIANSFIENLSGSNSCLIAEPISRAIRAAGVLELDNILTDLETLSKEDKPSPILRWRIITWAEKFGDEVNLIFPYDRQVYCRKNSGWWALKLLPSREVYEWDMNIRQPILNALPYADPDEGARLSAFIVEAAMVKELDMSDEDKKEFMVVSNQAKEMADNIFAAQTLLPIADRKNILANRMVNIRRIFSEDSAEAPSVRAPAERVLLTPPF